MSNLSRVVTLLALAVMGMTGCMRVEIEDPENGSFLDEPTTVVSGNVFNASTR